MAARFPDRGRASEMRELLRRKLPGEAPEVAIAPLGVPGQESTTDTVLAGRFHEEQAPQVAELVRECGGEIVANVDESWTRPRVQPHRQYWIQGLRGDGLHA